jgi:D-glycero-D-manno-heptose 1,7-bisphosphate phosphatase
MHLFDKSWTLFLDRDGVINERIPNDYVKDWEQFDFISGSIKAIERFANIFGVIVVVTNQAGVGKGLMTEAQLQEVHKQMLKTVRLLDGRIDKVYYAPDHSNQPSILRKPNVGMALQAQNDFPEIDFSRSIIVGDSLSDMEFGHKLGMFKVFIEGKGDDPSVFEPHYRFKNLSDFSKAILQNTSITI